MSHHPVITSGLRFVLLGNVAAFLSNLVLLRHHYGEAIRPMDLPAYWVIIQFGTINFGFPVGWETLRTETQRTRLYGLLAMIFSMTPLIAALTGMFLIAALMQFELKE